MNDLRSWGDCATSKPFLNRHPQARLKPVNAGQYRLARFASREELMEAIWVAAEMRAGGAYAHSALAIEKMG